jgi:arylsulfatase A-like enzyme
MREMNDAADPSMLARDAIRVMRRLEGHGPFFLVVFFSTAHFPYAAPAPYYGRFTDPAYRGRFKYDRPVGLEREEAPDEADIAQVRGLYDGAVASIDAASARILGALDRFGLAQSTIVVVVADHGETLWENGHGVGHGDHLFGDEGTHVPLVVFDPRRQGGKRTSSIVRDVDLAPTLYDLVGVEPPGDLDGRSLLPAMDGADLPPRLAYAETGLWFTEDIAGFDPRLRIPYPGVAELTEGLADHHDDVVLKKEMHDRVLVAKHRMVRDDRYKLVYLPTRAGVRYQLFDTDTDPGETHDVAADRPAEAQRLKGELWKWMLGDPDMVQRGGYLVPRVAGASEGEGDEASGRVIRIDSSGSTP